MADLSNKTVLVTGATSGIGRSTALAAASAGASVAFTGRREELGQKLESEITAAGGQALFIKADASNAADCQRMVAETVAKFGSIDGAINNAGIEGVMGPIVEFDEANYDNVMNINVKGVMLSLKYEIPAMLKSGGGSIVNMSSVAGLIGMPNASTYFASKHAVNGVTKVAALEVARQGIRINAVCPAAVDTDMLDRFADTDEAKQGMASMHPIGRVGKPEEIASLVLYLLSDASGFITGQCIAADGGWTTA